MLTFSEKDESVKEIMLFLAENDISIVKLEKAEPTLETLFLEVTGK